MLFRFASTSEQHFRCWFAAAREQWFLQSSAGRDFALLPRARYFLQKACDQAAAGAGFCIVSASLDFLFSTGCEIPAHSSRELVSDTKSLLIKAMLSEQRRNPLSVSFNHLLRGILRSVSKAQLWQRRVCGKRHVSSNPLLHGTSGVSQSTDVAKNNL